MGPRGLSHVVSLVSYYTTSKETEADRGVAMRAYNLTTDDESPLKLREFFGTVSKQQQLAHTNSTLFKMLHQNVLNLEVLDMLNDLKESIQEPDGELRSYLRAQGEVPTRGRGWSTCLINYLTRVLRLSSNAFSNLTHEAQGAHGLVEEFCPGVLCLLPKGGSYKSVTPAAISQTGNALTLQTEPFWRPEDAARVPGVEEAGSRTCNRVRAAAEQSIHTHHDRRRDYDGRRQAQREGRFVAYQYRGGCEEGWWKHHRSSQNSGGGY